MSLVIDLIGQLNCDIIICHSCALPVPGYYRQLTFIFGRLEKPKCWTPQISWLGRFPEERRGGVGGEGG